MEQQTSSFDKSKHSPIIANFDDFSINEDSFKPVTKGLGFHPDQKRQTSFKASPKEMTNFKTQLATSAKPSAHKLLNDLSNTNKQTTSKVVPSGLEAFYGAQTNSMLTSSEVSQVLDSKIFEENEVKIVTANSIPQFIAWTIDLSLVLSFAAITTTLLILVSGMSFQAFLSVIPVTDLVTFASVLFSIYYLMYFTVLDLSATPGKTIMGLRLLRSDNKNVSVKNTFSRSIVSLLSFIALFLPMVIDFQGRLSDTKVVQS